MGEGRGGTKRVFFPSGSWLQNEVPLKVTEDLSPLSIQTNLNGELTI